MKVWVIGRGYPTAKSDMLGSFELEQAHMLSRAGLEVCYLAVDLRSIRRRRQFGFLSRQEDGVSIVTLNLPVGQLLSKEARNTLYEWAMNRLTAYLNNRTGKPDVIHVHYPSLVPYSVVEKWQRQGTKIVATEHWSSVQERCLPPVYLENLTNYVNRSDAMCCVGSNLKNAIIELTGTERLIHIVPNIVNELFKPDTQSHEGFRFVCSGRLIPVKQFDTIVESFIDVFQNEKKVSLTVVGDGEEFKKIQAIVQKRNADDQVHLVGAVSRQKMADYMAECDALVVFSRLETFCVPVIEAWACGKPVIATDTTVLADNPDERLGVLADSQDPETLKNALRKIYEKHAAYDPGWIRQYAVDHFSEKAVSRRLIDIYNS